MSQETAQTLPPKKEQKEKSQAPKEMSQQQIELQQLKNAVSAKDHSTVNSIIKHWITKAEKFTAQDKDGNNPLFYLAMNPAYESLLKNWVKKMVDKDLAPNVYTRNNQRKSALFIAIDHDNLSALDTLDYISQTRKSETPLIYAVRHNRPLVVEWLLGKKDHRLDKTDGNGSSALGIALRNNHQTLLKILVKAYSKKSIIPAELIRILNKPMPDPAEKEFAKKIISVYQENKLLTKLLDYLKYKPEYFKVRYRIKFLVKEKNKAQQNYRAPSTNTEPQTTSSRLSAWFASLRKKSAAAPAASSSSKPTAATATPAPKKTDAKLLPATTYGSLSFSTRRFDSKPSNTPEPAASRFARLTVDTGPRLTSPLLTKPSDIPEPADNLYAKLTVDTSSTTAFIDPPTFTSSLSAQPFTYPEPAASHASSSTSLPISTSFATASYWTRPSNSPAPAASRPARLIAHDETEAAAGAYQLLQDEPPLPIKPRSNTDS